MRQICKECLSLHRSCPLRSPALFALIARFGELSVLSANVLQAFHSFPTHRCQSHHPRSHLLRLCSSHDHSPFHPPVLLSHPSPCLAPGQHQLHRVGRADRHQRARWPQPGNSSAAEVSPCTPSSKSVALFLFLWARHGGQGASNWCSPSSKPFSTYRCVFML